MSTSQYVCCEAGILTTAIPPEAEDASDVDERKTGFSTTITLEVSELESLEHKTHRLNTGVNQVQASEVS